MRRASFACIATALLATIAIGAVDVRADAELGAASVSTRQTIERFRAATGEKLVVDRRASTPGRYDAVGLRFRSASKQARFGIFTIYVVTSEDVETAVTELLADGHTGELGEPDRHGIHWEEGTTLDGDPYWLAKKRYGVNVVLWWFGSDDATTDATFRRLDRALRKVTR